MRPLSELHPKRPYTYRILFKNLNGYRTQLRQKRERISGKQSSFFGHTFIGQVLQCTLTTNPLNGSSEDRILETRRVGDSDLKSLTLTWNIWEDLWTLLPTRCRELKPLEVTNSRHQSMSDCRYSQYNPLDLISMDQLLQPAETNQYSQSATTSNQSRMTNQK